jgi:hypothetical protein
MRYHTTKLQRLGKILGLTLTGDTVHSRVLLDWSIAGMWWGIALVVVDISQVSECLAKNDSTKMLSC